MRRLSRHRSTNTDRWMVSYADFMTLLLAFFVVMYAVSSVNEGKYRILSDTLKEAFTPKDRRSMFAPMQRMDMVKETLDPIKVAQSESGQTPAMNEGFSKEALDDFEEALSKYLQSELSDSDLWAVTERDGALAMELDASILFKSGSAKLDRTMIAVVRTIGTLISEQSFSVDVEGYTDNQAIESSRYPSNWELSGARGAAIVRQFERAGIEPERMSFSGFGSYRPVASNDTDAGRAQNRRVVVVLTPMREYEE